MIEKLSHRNSNRDKNIFTQEKRRLNDWKFIMKSVFEII